ncbi:MAG: histidinol-phosphate transaminase [Alphaproteobacteria bacterium CG11_big_fil_rev_8_21_14_0_20_39_49]|nr:MAG: histidinol-phosphate transaminase [Alphaproteobacteria bacterium CG11_big_fil_rev_8_21_14_0_20_39_49]
MTLKPKESILKIQPYKGGLSKSKNEAKTIKLSSNETPLGASPKAIEAYKNEAGKLFRYPDGGATILREAIGQVYGLNPDRIVCGAGSDEIISFLCLAYAGAGDEVIYTEHGFLMYRIYSLTVGATPVSVPETDLKTSVDNILNAVTDKTKIVFIANPNNPTGSYISGGEVKRLRQNLRDDILLVLDGAYAEYVEKDDYTAGEDIVDLGENTVMTRTFSKIYGLAALRIGWAYCPESVADVLNRTRGPFNVSSASISAATAAVKDVEFTKKTKDFNNLQLQNMTLELNNIGLESVPSVGNFILVDFKNAQKANYAFEFLMEQGIIVRPVGNYGLDQFLRITIGLEDENKAVINALTQFMND